jgi:peptidoglycan/xylan/chitin deacetylase (PgdA/CDA1 family)
LDLDDLWTYLRTRGDAQWQTYPSYLPAFVPLALETFERLNLQLTFFIVGADAERVVNLPYLQALVEQGHEIGNHSFSHDCSLPRYGASEMESEIVRAEDAIIAATGQRPKGFRGPGFGWSPELLEILGRRGYLYDGSTLPTFLGPLARWYFFARSGLSSEDRKKKHALYGNLRDGFRPVRPYRWQLRGGNQLLEIPITTLPVVKLPFHMSYLLYLSRISTALMFAYLRLVIRACMATGTQPSFLLHPLDLLGAEQAPGLSFFPAMDLPGARKRDLVVQVLQSLAEAFRLVPMAHHAGEILAAGRLPERTPAFA